jgi:hypothetical protein
MRAINACSAVSLAVYITFAAGPVHATNYRYGVQVETVNSYSTCYGAGTNLSYSNSSGANFVSELNNYNNNGNIYTFNVATTANSCLSTTSSCWWQDGNVKNTDFQDPDTSGASSSDNDTNEFDQPCSLTGGCSVISFFQGHGFTFNQGTGHSCTSSNYTTACPAGPSGNTGTGCAITPGSEQDFGASGLGYCRWNLPQAVPAFVTCSTSDVGIHGVYFGSGNMAFGEDSTSGSWRDAGTNGGVGLIFAKHSFGMWMPFTSEWDTLFGGMDLWAGVAIGWNDSADSNGYGYAVIHPLNVNETSSIKSGYLSSMANISDGSGCPTATGGTSWPGGINGCGCHVIKTVSSTTACALNVIGQSWDDLYASAYSSCQTGKSVPAWTAVCNFSGGGWYGGP